MVDNGKRIESNRRETVDRQILDRLFSLRILRAAFAASLERAKEGLTFQWTCVSISFFFFLFPSIV